jgi:hypothetical protein
MDQLFAVVGLLAVLPPLAGAVVSAMHLGRTRWAAVLLAGFATHTVVALFFRLATMLLRSGSVGSSGIQVAFSVASLVGFLAAALEVVGVAGLLNELRSGAVARAAEVERA